MALLSMLLLLLLSLSLLLLLSLSLWSLLLLLLIFSHCCTQGESAQSLPLLQKNAAAAGTQKKRQRLVRWRPLEAGEGWSKLLGRDSLKTLRGIAPAWELAEDFASLFFK